MCQKIIKLIKIVFSTDVLKISIPALIVVLGWYVTEKNKIKWEQYQSKKESYEELIKNLSGFSKYQNDAPKRQNFIDQFNICWLYAPDEVIQKGYIFISTVGDGSENISDTVRVRALSDLILTIRKDMLSRKIVKQTKLTSDDFQYLRPKGD